MIRLARRAVSPMLAALVIGGCASYQRGNPADLPFERLYVRPATNETFLPQAQALVTGQVRTDLLRDGRIQLVSSEEEADAVLEIALTDYRRSPGARSGNDTVRALDFDLFLEAGISLYEPEGGRYLFRDRKIREDTFAYVDNPYSEANGTQQGFNQAEYQAVPRLTRGLSRQIVDAVLGAW